MERPNAKGANNFVVGLFVFVALLVGAGFVVFMGGSSLFGKEIKVRAIFDDVKGLNIGAPVFLSGIQVGRVAAVEFPEMDAPADVQSGIIVVMSVFGSFEHRVRKDSLASITTQGVLGDKVMVISPGTLAAGQIASGDAIVAKREVELTDYLAKGGSAVEDLAEAARNLNLLLKEIHSQGHLRSILVNLDKTTTTLASTSKDELAPAMKSLHAVLKKVERGDGTIGALINDSSLHEDLRALLGGAKRSSVVRFLVRQAISNNEKDKTPETNKKPK